MFILLFLIACTVAYLIGSIPTAYIVGKLFYKKDIRDFGSKNSGATNTLRVFGWKAALFVLIIDLLKGYLAVSIHGTHVMQLFLSLSVLLGHIFPIFAKFKGGKGVAVTYGCFLSIGPVLTIIPIFVWILTLLKWRISSLSSLLSIFSFAISFLIFGANIKVIILAVITFIIISWTHRENITRILHNLEREIW